MSNAQAQAVVRLNGDAYAAWMGRLKLHSEILQAEYLGISRANLGKARKGLINPGERFIAACMAKYDGTFEQLFEITKAEAS